jgi:hypothetical protein
MSRVLSVCAIASAAFAGFASTVFAAQDTLSEGRAVYVRANCVGCHKWHGDGGGGYGGAALSLRKTQLDKDEIMYTVMCGRPGTGMPYFRRDVYADDASAPHPCDGLTRHDLGDVGVAEATIFLRPPEIEAVVTYVLTAIKGKGEPNLQECVAFFGETSRVCDTYKTVAPHPMALPQTTN